MIPTNKQIRNAFKNKPIKSSAATNIMYKCQHILDDYGADYRGGHVENINGTNYVVFKYYGGPNDTMERNDDSWDEIYDLEGVTDVGYGEGYGDNMKGTNYHHNTDCLVIQLDDSIQSAREPMIKSGLYDEAKDFDPNDYDFGKVFDFIWNKYSTRIDRALNDLLYEIQEELGITTGDTFYDNNVDDCVHKLVEVLTDQYGNRS